MDDAEPEDKHISERNHVNIFKMEKRIKKMLNTTCTPAPLPPAHMYTHTPSNAPAL